MVFPLVEDLGELETEEELVFLSFASMQSDKFEDLTEQLLSSSWTKLG